MPGKPNNNNNACLPSEIIFQPFAIETLRGLGPSSIIFARKLGQKISNRSGYPLAASHLRQRIAIANQIGNAACVLDSLGRLNVWLLRIVFLIICIYFLYLSDISISIYLCNKLLFANTYDRVAAFPILVSIEMKWRNKLCVASNMWFALSATQPNTELFKRSIKWINS